jgi:hypothetical protein
MLGRAATGTLSVRRMAQLRNIKGWCNVRLKARRANKLAAITAGSDGGLRQRTHEEIEEAPWLAAGGRGP